MDFTIDKKDAGWVDVGWTSGVAILSFLLYAIKIQYKLEYTNWFIYIYLGNKIGFIHYKRSIKFK